MTLADFELARFYIADRAPNLPNDTVNDMARVVTSHNAKDVCDWINSISRSTVECHYDADGRILVRTPDGVMRARPGDWIVARHSGQEADRG